ncbi:MAG: competence protein ComEC [Glaciecola sp.]|jgi:competence protein ComEC
MFAFIIVFLSNLFWPVLPSIQIVATLVLALIVLSCLRFQIKTWMFGAILGFVWASSVGHWYSSWQLPNRYFNENVIIEGTVKTLQIQRKIASQINILKNTHSYVQSKNQHFEHKSVILQLSKIGKTALYHSPRVRLSWFEPDMEFQQGDNVRLLVSIKKPHALANEFGFNRQKWLVSQNIVGVGSIKASPTNSMLRANSSLRQKLANRLLLYSSKYNLQNINWILALSIGERSLFSSADWELLQTTGTAHLFAISGLHVGIVSLLFFHLTKAILFFLIKAMNRNQQANIAPLAVVASIPFCFFYAYLSGFQIPVIRSIIALSLVVYLTFYQLHWRPIAIFFNLLVCFFLLVPLSIIGMSFWFSFGAIFAICFFMWRYPRIDNSIWQAIKQTIMLQLFLSLIMLPLVAINFGIFSTVSALVNLVIMPVVGLLLVPMCLLLVMLTLLNINLFLKPLLQVLDWCFEQLLLFLQVFNNAQHANLEVQGIPLITWFIMLISLLLIFLPHWPHRKKVIGTLSLAMLSQSAPKQADSENWSVRVFDIGQGLSVLVRQNNQYLLYDTGQSFINGGSFAKTVIAPYFMAQTQVMMPVSKTNLHIPTLDYLINSHMDNDHAGGNEFVFSNYNVNQWLTPANGCTADDSFLWGELTLTILWPDTNESGNDNNHSCVIKIASRGASVLLTGDIEKEAEQALVSMNTGSSKLKSNVLVAAHHGSKTSSIRSFIQAVSPEYVVISSSYYNQWRFPHASVLTNFNELNATVYNTAYDGEVVFEFSNGKVKSKAYRQRWFSPWYMQIK